MTLLTFIFIYINILNSTFIFYFFLLKYVNFIKNGKRALIKKFVGETKKKKEHSYLQLTRKDGNSIISKIHFLIAIGRSPLHFVFNLTPISVLHSLK